MNGTQLTSWSLIERAAAGDPRDRDAFATRYSGVIRAFLTARWRLPLDHPRVDDAVQEVFLQCFKHQGVLVQATEKRPACFRAYLFGTSKHVAMGIERREAAQGERPVQNGVGDIVHVQGSEERLSLAFDRAWAKLLSAEARRLAMHRATNERSQLAMRALGQRFREGASPAEIASRLEVDVALVYELLREAKRLFQAAFMELMAVHNPGVSEGELRRRCVELARLL